MIIVYITQYNKKRKEKKRKEKKRKCPLTTSKQLPR